MQIDYNILRAYGGVAKKVSKDEIVFEEGTIPRFYYQIIEGEVTMFCSNTEGKELIQSIYKSGDGFGGASLLIDKQHPNAARVSKDGVLVKITKSKLLNIFRDYPNIERSLLYTFADRLNYKSSLSTIWVSPTPEEKIQKFLELNYEKEGVERTEIELTRQQIANYTGLRVETVIRTLKKMSKEGKVAIINRKLFY